jgi:ribonuclease D
VNEEIDIHPIWVNEQPRFQELMRDLASAAVVGVDTESNSLHAYREQVCLVQFSTASRDYLLDPLGDLDLAPLNNIFSAKGIVKVFHASEYDIICLRRDFSFEFHNIFDTMQAARILGREKFSLGDLVEAEFGIHLDKHNQKANWAMRPMPPAMQSYGCLDTHFLTRLYFKLKEELKIKGLDELAAEDFERLSHSKASENHKPQYTQVSGYQELDRRQLVVLNQLCLYRDRLAHKHNLPLFKVLSNAMLLEVAQRCPRTEQGLRRMDALPLRLFERHASGLMEAVFQGMKAAPIDLPARSKPDRRFLARLDGLKTWRKKKAEELKVLSDVVLPKDILEELAGRNPQDPASLQTMMESVPWRRERFGMEILKVLQESH